MSSQKSPKPVPKLVPKPQESGPIDRSPMQLAQRPSTNALATALKNAWVNSNYKPESYWADEAKGGSRPAPKYAKNLLGGPLPGMNRADFERMYRNASEWFPTSDMA